MIRYYGDESSCCKQFQLMLAGRTTSRRRTFQAYKTAEFMGDCMVSRRQISAILQASTLEIGKPLMCRVAS